MCKRKILFCHIVCRDDPNTMFRITGLKKTVSTATTQRPNNSFQRGIHFVTVPGWCAMNPSPRGQTVNVTPPQFRDVRRRTFSIHDLNCSNWTMATGLPNITTHLLRACENNILYVLTYNNLVAPYTHWIWLSGTYFFSSKWSLSVPSCHMHSTVHVSCMYYNFVHKDSIRFFYRILKLFLRKSSLRWALCNII